MKRLLLISSVVMTLASIAGTSLLASGAYEAPTHIPWLMLGFILAVGSFLAILSVSWKNA